MTYFESEWEDYYSEKIYCKENLDYFLRELKDRDIKYRVEKGIEYIGGLEIEYYEVIYLNNERVVF